MQNYTVAKNYNFSMKLPNVKSCLKKKEKIIMSRVRYQSQNTISSKTKNFIQRLCYRKAPSIDMTRHGFVNDTKFHPVQLMIKPLVTQLEKIMGKHEDKIIIPRRRSPPRQKRLLKNYSRPLKRSYDMESLATPRRANTSIQAGSDFNYTRKSRKRWST